VIGFLFWFEMNDRSNRRESWFDYKAKANGSIAVKRRFMSASAIEQGKKLGRPFGFSYHKLKKHHNKIVELLNKGLTKAEIARILNCS